jgi:hypothetical protein
MFPIMSRQEQYKMKAMELYEQMLNSTPPMQSRNKLADDVVFSDPTRVGALQAADLAVYWFSKLNTWRAKNDTTMSDRFPGRAQIFKLVENVRDPGDLKLFNFESLMLVLQGCNRYIRTSIQSRDQLLPSLPLARRKEVLGVMRKVDFRRFLDHETLTLREDHG